MTDSLRILIVEDDPPLAREMVLALEREGWPVDHVSSLAAAFEAVLQYPYRAILLDRRLPDGDGLSLIGVAKSRPSPPAIIFLTARDEVEDKIEGLDAGAEDYLVKPFVLGELFARLRAACRRTPVGNAGTIEAGRLIFNPATREARVGNRALRIPRRELELLELLVRRAGRVVPRAHLESQLYGFDAEVTPNAVEALASRLRRRLEDEEAGLELRPIRGVGYMLHPC